jgi:hypothetical protein
MQRVLTLRQTGHSLLRAMMPVAHAAHTHMCPHGTKTDDFCVAMQTQHSCSSATGTAARRAESGFAIATPPAPTP